MLSSLSHSPREADQIFTNLLRQRSRPCVVVLDADGNAAFAEARALSLFESNFRALQNQVEDLIRGWQEGDGAAEHVLGPVDGLVLRIVPLKGSHARYYAVFFETEARREDLRDAVSRFAFTPREVEVLDRILGGMNAAEIAAELCIAEVTVFDHFKHISHKTKARNRADMLAKIFNWQPELKSRSKLKYGVDRRIARNFDNTE